METKIIILLFIAMFAVAGCKSKEEHLISGKWILYMQMKDPEDNISMYAKDESPLWMKFNNDNTCYIYNNGLEELYVWEYLSEDHKSISIFNKHKIYNYIIVKVNGSELSLATFDPDKPYALGDILVLLHAENKKWKD